MCMNERGTSEVYYGNGSRYQDGSAHGWSERERFLSVCCQESVQCVVEK